jgi:hypothetical protein
LLIRGLLPEVLIAEPCINFTCCREGFSAGEGCEVEQTGREVAVPSRVLGCEFAWLIRLVALAIILGGPFCGCFFGFAGRRTRARMLVRWEWLGFSLAGLRLAKGPVDFASASLGRLRGRHYYKSRRYAGGRGCLGWEGFAWDAQSSIRFRFAPWYSPIRAILRSGGVAVKALLNRARRQPCRWHGITALAT